MKYGNAQSLSTLEGRGKFSYPYLNCVSFQELENIAICVLPLLLLILRTHVFAIRVSNVFCQVPDLFFTFVWLFATEPKWWRQAAGINICVAWTAHGIIHIQVFICTIFLTLFKDEILLVEQKWNSFSLSSYCVFLSSYVCPYSCLDGSSF